MNQLIIFAFLFFIGCMMGWGIELFYRRFLSKNNPDRKWINPGFLIGPWLPIYGSGLCGMYLISDFIMANDMTGIRWVDTLIILLFMALVMTAIELVAGLFFNRFFHVSLWDYSNERFNFKGVICLKFSIIWGILGCFYYFVINPYVMDGIIWLSQHLTFSFFIGAFFGVFGVDVGYSMQIVNKMRRFAEEKEVRIHYEELKANLAGWREEQEEKARFLLAFRSSQPLRESLERYIGQHVKNGEARDDG